MAEWFQNVCFSVADAFIHLFISSIPSITARDGFVFGLGVTVGAGMMATRLSVAAIFNVVVSWIPGTKAYRSNRNSAPTGNPTCVKDLEKKYFHGIDEKANLYENKIQQLKEFLEILIREMGEEVEENVKKQEEFEENVKTQEEVEENVKKLTACTTLAGILELLSDLKLVQPKSYRKILTILTKIDVNVESLVFHIDGLEQAVSDIEAERTPREYEHDHFELDVLILHTEADRLDACAFKKHIIADSGIQGLLVQVYEEFDCGKGKLNVLGDIFTRTRYIFVFVTKNLVGENLTRFLTEAALVDSLEDTNKNWRIIPVWTTSERLNVPEIRALKGLKYWHFTNNNGDKLYIDTLHKTLVDGREKFVREI